MFDPGERDAILDLVVPLADLIAPLSIDGRLTLLCSMLAQEVCNLPPMERREAMRQVIEELPEILDASERGMREALVEKARDGGPRSP